MLSKRSPAPILTGDRRSPSPATSPRSPNRWSYDSDGVGLGIVAALDKPSPGHKLAIVCSPRPISAAAARAAPAADWTDSESYTCVTCRGSPAQPPVTTVYYDGAEVGLPRAAKQDEPRNGGVFVVFMESPPSSGGEKIGFLTSDFLSYCYLCHKKLHGKDIFMYRGEKAFCSAECRYQQIVSDEYMETCGSEVTMASDVAVSVISHDQFFLPGIAAA